MAKAKKKKPGRPGRPKGRQGHALCRARTAIGLTQAQAAKMLGVQRATYNGWEQGRPRLPRYKLGGVLAALREES